jgi:hypothetical protein
MGNTVSLVIDQVVQAPVVAFASFNGGANNTQAFFGCTGRDIAGLHDDTITSTVEWHSFHVHTQAPVDLVRTIGVLQGMTPGLDEDDINNYEVPRTDTSTAPNSWATGPAIEWWDWRSDVELRVYRDPSWGVTVIRPDLPAPPYYQPEDGTAGTGFVTDSTEPSAGWINVEYRNLPRTDEHLMGLVDFGSLHPECISQTVWDYVRYRLFKYPTEDLIAPEHMVLNQFNVITSGELGRDRELETVILQTMDKTRISLLPTHLYAKSVYKVIDGSTIWTSAYWSFDPLSQLLTLQPDPLTGEAREFSSEHANVTVMFVPGEPVTNTYLQGQPLLDGVTLLNEGTPPVPKNQTGNSESEVYGPSIIDPYQAFRHKNITGTLYEDLEFIEVTDEGQTGLIASICEGGPGQGFSGLATDEGEDIYSKDGAGDPLGGVGGVADLFATGDKVGLAVGAEVFDFSGTQFWQDTSFLPTPDYGQKGGAPGGILFASGGNFVNPVVDALGNILPGQWVAGGGNLGPGTAVLYPSFPAKGPHGGDQGRIYRRTEWFMDLRSVLAGFGVSAGGSAGTPVEQPLDEDWDTASWGDVAAGQLLGAGDYSRYGPWGGWDSLSPARDWAAWILTGLVEGSTLPLWDRVGLAWVTFTARAVPALVTDFLLTPNPHTELATVINAHPVIGQQYEAVAGLTLSGQLMVTVFAYEPSTSTDPAVFYMGPLISTYATTLNAIPTGVDLGVMAGGAKIAQSSLLAGGTRTLDHNNAYDPRLGMVALGGQPLPEGSESNLIFP